MVNIQIDIDNEQNKLVNMCKLSKNLSSKQDAMKDIIKDWGRIQLLDKTKIKDLVLKKWIEENSKELKGIKLRMKKAYLEYDKGIENIGEKLSKKFKFPIQKIWDIIDYTGEDAPKGKEKLYEKIYDEWENEVSNLQDKVIKNNKLEYDSAEVQHDEAHWSIKVNDFWGLDIWYDGETEKEKDYNIPALKNKKYKKKIDLFIIRLDYRLEKAIDYTIDFLRGENSLNDIIKESKEYLEKAEKEAENITEEDEEYIEAQEALMGV